MHTEVAFLTDKKALEEGFLRVFQYFGSEIIIRKLLNNRVQIAYKYENIRAYTQTKTYFQLRNPKLFSPAQ
jgi:hypothetical protein